MAGKTFRELAAETAPALTRIIPTQDPVSGQPTKSTLTQLFAVLPAVENAGLADMAQSTIKGRAASAGTGDPTDLTATQVRTILNVEDGATADQSAAEVPYDNGDSGLTADDVQAAVDELAEGAIPAGTTKLAYRAADGTVDLLEIGANLSIDDGALVATAEPFAGVGGESEEIDGSVTLTEGQQRAGYDIDGVLRTRSCWFHNTANEAGAATLSVPWDTAVAYPGAVWEVVRSTLYTGAWTIDRQTKTIDLVGTTTNSSAVVTPIDTSDLEAGIGVSGTGIPGATTVLSIDSATQLTLSANATASGSPTLTFNFGKIGTLNRGTSALTVSLVEGAKVTISVVPTDDPGDAPDVRVEGDLAGTTLLLGPLDCDDKLVTDALLSGATLNDDLDANSQSIIGLSADLITTGGALSVAAHSGAVILTNANVTVPTTAGFHCILIAGGAHTVTFNSTVSAAMASGDIMSVYVQSSTVIRARLSPVADQVAFA